MGVCQVNINNLWSHIRYLEEVYQNVINKKLSLSKGQTPLVSKSLGLRNAFFIMDGHHRIMESIMNGETEIYVHWNEYYPYLDSGIGNELPFDKIKVVDFLKGKSTTA